MALTLDDVVMRRTGIGAVRPAAARKHSTTSRAIMAAELGWSEERRAARDRRRSRIVYRTQEAA